MISLTSQINYTKHLLISLIALTLCQGCASEKNNTPPPKEKSISDTRIELQKSAAALLAEKRYKEAEKTCVEAARLAQEEQLLQNSNASRRDIWLAQAKIAQQLAYIQVATARQDEAITSYRRAIQLADSALAPQHFRDELSNECAALMSKSGQLKEAEAINVDSKYEYNFQLRERADAALFSAEHGHSEAARNECLKVVHDADKHNVHNEKSVYMTMFWLSSDMKNRHDFKGSLVMLDKIDLWLKETQFEKLKQASKKERALDFIELHQNIQAMKLLTEVRDWAKKQPQVDANLLLVAQTDNVMANLFNVAELLNHESRKACLQDALHSLKEMQKPPLSFQSYLRDTLKKEFNFEQN